MELQQAMQTSDGDVATANPMRSIARIEPYSILCQCLGVLRKSGQYPPADKS
jgi:hypothetical protein